MDSTLAQLIEELVAMAERVREAQAENAVLKARLTAMVEEKAKPVTQADKTRLPGPRAAATMRRHG